MKLTLNKERLAELTTDELANVVGAAPWTPWCNFFITLQERLSEATAC